MKKMLLILVILLAAAGLAGKVLLPRFTTPEAKEPAEKPKLVAAQKGLLRVVVEATGRVVPEEAPRS